MDLWDVTKVLWRRRWIALPMLLASALVAFHVVSTVRSDYQATGHVTLLPPSQQRAVDPKAASAPQTVSPWNVYSLADALVIYAGRADVKREFASAGFSEEFTVTIGGTQLPVVEAEVVASSPEMARATMDRLIEWLGLQLKRLQQPYGVQGGQAITAATLDSGQNIQVINSAKKRMLIVVAAIGLILTVSICLGLDALLGRRGIRTATGSAATRSGDSPEVPVAGAPSGATARKIAEVARLARVGIGRPSHREDQVETVQVDETVTQKLGIVARRLDHASSTESQVIGRPVLRDERSDHTLARRRPFPPTSTGGEANEPAESKRAPRTSAGFGATPRAVVDDATKVMMIDYRLSNSDADPSNAAASSAPPPDESTVVLPLAGTNGWAGPAPQGNHRPDGAKPR